MQVTRPSHCHTNGRIYFYGYDITLDWLVDYTKTHWKDHAGKDRLALMGVAIQFLKTHTGIHTLTYRSALVDSTAPTNRSIDGHRPGERMVPILSICTSERSSYKKRPSQAQVDALSRIMNGRQPRWWIDYELPSSYV